MTEKFDASVVQSALENHTWTFESNVYKRGEKNDFGYRPYAITANGDLIIEGTETLTAAFEWNLAEDDGKGYLYEDVDGIGDVEVVDTDPGGEGHGEHIWVVVRTLSTDQYFKIDGYYQSYGDGSVYDGNLYEVFPREKTVTIYE